MAPTPTPTTITIQGARIARTPEAAADFVLKNPALGSTLRVEETINLLKALSSRIHEREGPCIRFQQAATFLLRANQSTPARLELITKGLGGVRWIEGSMKAFTSPELQKIAGDMIAQAKGITPRVG
jgi:hypothetical protein